MQEITFYHSLTDICKFLSEEIENGNMSPKARNKTKELIDRSRTQLKEIAKVTQTIESERYVDMQGHKGNF